MRYKILAQLYEDLSSTTKRLEKIKILSKFLIQISDKDNEILYLLQGDIYPEYNEKRIGISNQLAIKAISRATGTEPERDRKYRRGRGAHVATCGARGPSLSRLGRRGDSGKKEEKEEEEKEETVDGIRSTIR